MKDKSEKISFALALVLVTVILFVLVGTVYAAHNHYWTKMSETTVTDSWGNEVQQCMWECEDIFNNVRHTTVTQGYSWCPRP